MEVVVREFDPEKDKMRAEAMESSCDVGTGKISLYTDQLGDPVGRVAEIGEEIVGLIRGCVKTVTCGTKTGRNGKPPTPLYTKLAYILGLRVLPAFRRKGIALKLVSSMEQWFVDGNNAEYSYMATEKLNHASLALFTTRCNYTPFRTPSILVHPVFAHRLRLRSKTTILRLTPSTAESLYRLRLSTTDFFPSDIDKVLSNPLSLGTFLATTNLNSISSSWAVVSIWNSTPVFKLQLKGVSRFSRIFAKTSRSFDRAFPWLNIPSVPNLFDEPFGFYFLYGWDGEGPRVRDLVTALCGYAHNLAMKGGCRVVVTEVARGDPIRDGIPHWKRLSCADDVWCVKRLREEDSYINVNDDWTLSKPGTSIFVDPRNL